uniref:(4-O-methyl)-D-glucuronate--lignin esterase n=1 Tax=Piromyces sp. TaxID=45796 RepID=A0A2S1TZC9_PIRSP|nr:Carboxyl esterase family 15 [Piromyces sp.]
MKLRLKLKTMNLVKKPAPPQNIKATYSGGTLTVTVNDNGGSLTLTSKLSVPSGNGPFPVIIGMNSNTGSLSASQFSGFIQVPFNHDQCAQYSMNGQKNTNAPFYRMYPNLRQAGDYIAWSWGISRLIDGLELVKNQIHADMNHIGVTGCSYAGKMALFGGAFDERVALTIPQESGGGGINSWRVSDTIGNVEKIDNTNYSWFMQALKNNFNGKASRLPYDHHELIAMVAPRAFYTMGNPDYEWLGDKSGYTSAMAAYEVWKAMGVEDRFGFNFVGGHMHCSAHNSQVSDVNKFIDKFLRGKNTNTSNILNSTVKNDYDSWISAWKGHKIDTSSGSVSQPTTTKRTTTKPTTAKPTSQPSSGSCWATKLGYPCCKSTKIVVETDANGRWGLENNNWCGIVETSCWASKLGYKCCSSKCPQEVYLDNDGSWAVENNNWCGITKKC